MQTEGTKTDRHGYFTGPELARLAGISEVWLHKLRKAGEAPPYRREGRRLLYPVFDAMAWLEDRSNTPPRKRGPKPKAKAPEHETPPPAPETANPAPPVAPESEMLAALEARVTVLEHTLAAMIVRGRAVDPGRRIEARIAQEVRAGKWGGRPVA